MSKRQVTIIPGDGIGPEVVAAARKLIDATGVGIEWIEAEAGASVFKKGIASGVPKDTIEAISRTRIALKGPLETPVGYGEKSANVTLRKLFETFGNLRPVRELPGVPTPYSGRGVDLIVVRENVEDLYAGIEHMQTPSVAQCLKLISAKGCEKIVRLAFEVARAEGRNSVHCATKANIMKLTEGLLKRTFERIAPEYPDIQAHHIIIDNCAHQLVKKPEQFEVIVTTNMNGDIISDLTSALIGGLGFAPSANIGNDIAIFEAVHGSAPKYAGKDVINPTAMILSGVMMLRYLQFFDAAATIENAVLVTLQEGKARTRDVVGDAAAVGTRAYTDAILANFGKKPTGIKTRTYRPLVVPKVTTPPLAPKQRGIAGLDVFVEANLTPTELGPRVERALQGTRFKLKMISNRGTMVYPPTGANTDCVDHWRCRLLMDPADEAACTAELPRLLQQIEQAGLRWMHVEKLPVFNGEAGFTKAQGED
ncbi:MAG: NADP-dependent isocitrate dehydrogenase [Verrucomicrobiae bacterium]|nr:NADP-dependent isocitrate dehydrogenase [Verrucomicrobiae bacterium]